MNNKVNYALLGFIIVALFGIAIGIIAWWTMALNSPKYTLYEVDMYQDVTGLSVQAPVKFNGVTVGYVDSMQLSPKNSQEVVLLLKINADTPISTSTVATLMPQGITGINYIGLRSKKSTAPALKAKPDQKYPIIATEPSLLKQLNTIIEGASSQVQGLTMSIEHFVDAQNAQYFKKILANLAQVTQALAKNEAGLNQMMITANQVLANTNKASQQLPELMAEAKQNMLQLDVLSTNINRLVPSLQQMLNEVTAAAQTINSISAQVASNPSVLLKGTKADQLGPGE